MSHFNKQKEHGTDARSLGDEWEDWDGKEGETVVEGKGLFLITAASVILIINAFICLFIYFITPRLGSWHSSLPIIAWTFATITILLTVVWYVQIALTILTRRNFLFFKRRVHLLFDLIFSGVFRLANLIGVSRDRMGHSFIRAYNDMSRATKPAKSEERLLILLPRCLTKKQLKEINSLKDLYPLHIHTVAGGELARKKIKEIGPTAVIGIACERDLVSGIRDVGKKLSLIGITNMRPEGPCKNTHINMKELIQAIEFYVGPPANPIRRRESIPPQQ